MKTMNRLTIGRARDLIKRELGISATSLTAPSDMNGNPDYPWYEMFPGNQHIEVTTDDIRQGKYTDKMIALCVTHMNSSKGTSEYFYSDTLEYSEIYTEWKNRGIFCETMESPDDDPALRRLKKEALDDSRKHFHVPIRQEERVSQHDTEINTSPTEETSVHDNFQGKLKIKISDLHGTYIHDTGPFDETKLNWWVDLETKHINDSHLLSGLTVFQWDYANEMWLPYRPDGIHEMIYDTGRRPDGKVHETCKRELFYYIKQNKRYSFGRDFGKSRI